MPLARAARALAPLALLVPLLVPAVGGAAQAAQRDVVVRGAGAAEAVRAAGGRVRGALPLVDGVAATLPAGARLAPGLHVAEDRPVRLTAAADAAVLRLGGSLHTTTSGATGAWSRTRGAGVAVAVLDTGVAAVPALAGRVLHGPDLSGEAAPATDSYGHGTVMAGLIAARSALRPGVAPDARIVSVKVAGRDGATSLSTVLAGMGWVAQHAPALGVRVLNLSWGVAPSADDPLHVAVGRLRDQGIVVVAAVGNGGAGAVLSPADAPRVVSVGALDDAGTAATGDDAVPAWSARDGAGPDLLAPGRSVVSTVAPGSRVAQENPGALVGDAHVRGSGTSQAAAVVSGAAALLLSARPELTPDQVEQALLRGAARGPDGSTPRVDAATALVAPVDPVTVAPELLPLPAPLPATVPATATVRAPGAATDAATDTAATPTAADGGAPAAWAWTAWAWTAWAWTAWAWTADSWSAWAWTDQSWTDQGWATAFWGAQPRWDQRVPGERSGPRPAGCAAPPVCQG